jgi:hypothetical protein
VSPAISVQPEWYETGGSRPRLSFCSIRMVRGNQEGLKLKGNHQVAVSATDVNMLSENIKTEKGNTEGVSGTCTEGACVSERECVLWLVTTLHCRVMI